MALAHFQRTFTGPTGVIQPGISVTVRNESTGAMAAIYTDKEGQTSAGNPLKTDATGYLSFYAKPGRYRITGPDIDWRNEDLVTFEALDEAVQQATMAADAAILNSGIYATEADGLAATSDTEYFSVQSPEADEYLILYRNDAGTATAVDTYPNKQAVDAAIAEFNGGLADVNAALGDRVLYVDSIADLLALNTAALKDGQQVSAGGYHVGSFVGGDTFYWDASRLKSAHNGGTLISPTVPWDGTQATLADFLEGVGETDAAGSGVFVRRVKGDKISPEDFGATGGADDTASIAKALLFDGKLGGSGTEFTISTASRLPCNLAGIDGLKIKLAPNSAFFEIPNTHDFFINRLELDGQRGTFTELWEKFASYDGVDSVQPSVTQAIRSSSNERNVFIANSSFKNIFAESVLYNGGGGCYYYDNLYFENIANKIAHSFHTSRGVGNTFMSRIEVKGSGVLPATFDYDDGTTTTSVTFGDAGMPMAQGSFGLIATYGNAFFSDIEVSGYGSIAVCCDRNKYAKCSNINVFCDDGRAVSNNPSGAIWNEFCDEFILDNWTVDIAARSNRSFAEDACLQMAIAAGSVNRVGRGTMIYPVSSYIRRPLRMSSDGGALIELSQITASGDSGSLAQDIFHGYSASATVKDRIYLDRVELDGKEVRFSPAEVLSLTNCDISTTAGALQTYDSSVAGISNQTGLLILTKTELSLGGGATFSQPIQRLEIDGGRINGQTNIQAKADKVTISGWEGAGRLVVTANYQFSMSNSLVHRRIEFLSNANSSDFISLSGNTIGNNEGTSTVLINDLPLAATVTGNTLLIQSGTAGASYINSFASLVDVGNNKQTVAYTF